MNFFVQEICYRLNRYDVRGTLRYVEKGCRAVTSCTTNMYSGLCDGRECVRCIDNPSTCSVPGSKRERFNIQYYRKGVLHFVCHELPTDPTDLREPRQIQSPSLSPQITHGISSSSPSSLLQLLSSLTRLVFHSDIKTWLFLVLFSPS